MEEENYVINNIKMREFNLRERAEIVTLAQECATSLAAQPLIDYFNKSYLTKFENNGTTIANSIINKYFPDCNDTFRDTIHSIMLDFTFSFEHTLGDGENNGVDEDVPS